MKTRTNTSRSTTTSAPRALALITLGLTLATPACKGKASCAEVVENVTNVFVAEQGANSFFQTKGIPQMTANCESTKSLEEQPAGARCMADAKTVEALSKCEAFNQTTKLWLRPVKK